MGVVRQGRLPSGYREVPYVEALRGTFQMIAFDIAPVSINNKQTEINLSTALVVDNSNDTYIFRAANAYGGYINMVGHTGGVASLYAYSIGSTSAMSQSRMATNLRYEVRAVFDWDAGKKYLYENNVKTSEENYVLSSQYEYIDRVRFGNPSVKNFGMRFYNGDINYIVDGVKVFDAVPCRRISDNKVGFYDLISRQFEYSDMLTAGGDV